eukprot:10208306-Heterocapsa_arctica.AAC.1
MDDTVAAAGPHTTAQGLRATAALRTAHAAVCSISARGIQDSQTARAQATMGCRCAWNAGSAVPPLEPSATASV